MSTATALAGTYNADPVHSSFGFAVKYQNVSLFRGTLGDVTASLVDGRLEGSAKVESISIRTPEQFRAHVLSADFFDVENHPKLTFKSNKVTKTEDGFDAVGDLTMRGVTKEITLKIEGPTDTSKDPWGNTRIGASATAKVNRKDWGLNWNVALEAGGVLVAEQVKLSLEISLIQEAAK